MRRYEPIDGHYDEVIGASGLPRRHWRRLSTALMRLGEDRLGRRWQQARQLIQSNGITYNVYGDPQGSERIWPLDPIPLVLAGKEWAQIEAAVAQRAMLLNTILGDLYGAQKLVREMGLPPDLVFQNPGFLRPCRGLILPQDVHLFYYAADIARSPDGQWWVLADRTQAPSGAGYALENRLVSAQTLPEAFHRSRVRQLTRYFETYRESLMALAPRNRDNPRIVLLTPGPYNETYFEHAYMAKQMGYTLVEGPDLTVRGDRVYLKTLGGLVPVDVILRRQDDTFCDPLELRGDSVLGVPGLVHVIRSGHVMVANSLGSGLLETAGHMAFLPGLCRQVLGEELMMPSVATWWCGQEGPRRYVLENMERLVIKPAYPRFGLNPVFGASLSRAEREQLARQIEARPFQYVGQEQVSLSTAPVWTDKGFDPRYVVLRVFACYSGGGYTVLPGGLTRVSTSSESLVVTMQRGGGSKDTWVLSEEDEEPSAAQVRPTVDATRTIELPSRVADNLFWLGRYVERVETLVRVARALVPALSGECDLGGSISVEAAVGILAGFRYLPEEMTVARPHEQLRSLERALATMLFDPHRAAGLIWTANQVRRIAWQLKERLSSDTWRVINQLDKEFQRSQPPGSVRLLAEIELLDRSVMTLSAFAGLMMESMTRGPGWRFLDIGRRLERSLQMVDLLKHGMVVTHGELAEHLETLLRVADSSITYRSRYYTAMQADLVLDLLLVDESNPRSAGFQIASLSAHTAELPKAAEPGMRQPPEARRILKAFTAVRLARTDELARANEEGVRVGLDTFLESLRADLHDFSEALSSRYLSHAQLSRMF